MTMETYPIEIEFPDLRPYAEGNTGIPYVYTYDSGVPGPHTMINALTHGNEVSGAIAVKALIDGGVRPRRAAVVGVDIRDAGIALSVGCEVGEFDFDRVGFHGHCFSPPRQRYLVCM